MAETQTVTHPVIQTTLCGADHDCVDLCEAGVIEISPERLEPVVAHPEKCVEGCTLCVDICSKDAIVLETSPAA